VEEACGIGHRAEGIERCEIGVWACIQPLRGWRFPLFQFHGLTPVVIDVEPLRGLRSRLFQFHGLAPVSMNVKPLRGFWIEDVFDHQLTF
jgi:hypothetical protein